MAEFTGGPADAKVKLVVDHESPTDAGSYCKHGDGFNALARSIFPFTVGNRAHIVEQRSGQSGALCDRLGKRYMGPGAIQIWQEQRLTLFKIKHAGNTYADAPDILFLLSGFIDHLDDKVSHTLHHCIMALPGERGNAVVMQHLTFLDIHNCCAQIRSAEIDSNIFLHTASL